MLHVLNEPSIGLYQLNVEILLEVSPNLIDSGATVIVI